MEQPKMNIKELIKTAGTLVADYKGILAKEEKKPTKKKNFIKLINQKKKARRPTREKKIKKTRPRRVIMG